MWQVLASLIIAIIKHTGQGTFISWSSILEKQILTVANSNSLHNNYCLHDYFITWNVNDIHGYLINEPRPSAAQDRKLDQGGVISMAEEVSS